MATRTPVKAAPTERAADSFGAYDLVLMLDTGVEPKARAGVLADVKGAIAADGELLRHDEWGTRALAYPIQHREQAEYHLLQFRPHKAQVLFGLDRSLRIADEVLRFRIVKIRPGTPDPPDVRARPQATAEVGAAPVESATPAASVVAELPAIDNAVVSEPAELPTADPESEAAPATADSPDAADASDTVGAPPTGAADVETADDPAAEPA
jgi:small subunit ribosomal protein S6